MNTKKKIPNLILKKIKKVIYEFEDDSKLVINDGQKYFDVISEYSYSIQDKADDKQFLALSVEKKFSDSMREVFKTNEGTFYTEESLDEWNEYRKNKSNLR